MKRFFASLALSGLIGASGICFAENAADEKKLFDAAVAQVDVGGSYLAYCDMHTLGSEVDKLCDKMLRNFNGQTDEETLKTIKLFWNALNLHAVQGVASSSRSADGVIVNKSYTLLDKAAPQGLLFAASPWENRPLSMRSMILPGARLAFGGYLRPDHFWQAFCATVQQCGGEVQALPVTIDASVQANLEVPFAELLAALNGEFFLMVSEEESIQALLILPDANGALRKVIEKQFGAFLLQSNDGFIVPAESLPFPGMAPEIIFEKGRVVVTLSRQYYEKAKAGGNMEDNAEYGAYFRDMPSDGQAFFYLNVTRSLATMLSAMSGEPALQAVIADMKLPVVYGVSRTAGNGVLNVFRSNYSINELQTAIPLAIYSGMLLPSLNNARGKAQTVGCTSNLRQIGIGLVMYQMDHDGKFPAEPGIAGLKKLFAGEYLMDLPVYVCPAADEKSGTVLSDMSCSYLYLGNVPAEPGVPLVLEKPGHHDDKCNVLFADGHVETLAIGTDDPVEVVEYLAERGDLKSETVKLLLGNLQKLGYTED